MKALKITLTIILTLFLFHTLRAHLVWNYAAKFEGTNSSYIAVPNTSIYNKNMSSYFLRPVTAECWIYPENASQPEKQIILQKAAGNNPSGFALYLNQGRPSVKVNNVHVFSSVTQVPSQRWSHIAISYDNFSGSWSIYINGILYSQQFYNLNKISNTDSLYIGKGSESPFKGYIDEVRLWARALTATEFGRNFRSTLATYSGFNTNYNVPNDLAPNGVYTNLIISLTFQDDEQVGTIFSMSDWSGCGFNAKNNGVTAMDLELPGGAESRPRPKPGHSFQSPPGGKDRSPRPDQGYGGI